MLLDLRSLWETASNLILKSDVDSATATEAAILIALTDADQATATDLAQLIAILTPGDVAAITDAAAQIALTDADSAAAADAATVIALLTGDSATAADALAAIGLTATESVLISEAVALIGLGVSDAGAGSEGIGGIGLATGDTAAVSDQATADVTASDADVATSSDLAQLIALMQDLDSGAVTDAVLNIIEQLAISDADTAAALDDVLDLTYIIPPALGSSGIAATTRPRYREGVELTHLFNTLVALYAIGVLQADEVLVLGAKATERLAA